MRTSEVQEAEGGAARLAPLKARTQVEGVVEAILEAAAKGIFLPGDRVVEAEVARELKVSRVPVREALRLLESQGIVVNTPYRGMRLMDVSLERLIRILKVRLALERLAAAEVRATAAQDPAVLAPLDAIVAEMQRCGARDDAYGVARLDTEFHRCLCRLTGNDVLLQTWEQLSRQLTIIFGLAALQKPLDSIIDEHTELLAALRTADDAALDRLMEVHILEYTCALDYPGFVERLRRLESRRDASD